MKYDDLNPFAKAYIQCMLFAETDDSDESGGDPLDSNYGPEDLAPETIQQVHEDCSKFEAAHSERWADVPDRTFPDGTYSGEESAGHDFWYTRNGHGVGFWDPDRQRLYGEENAEALDQASKEFGSCNAYVGDDGMIYLM